MKRASSVFLPAILIAVIVFAMAGFKPASASGLESRRAPLWCYPAVVVAGAATGVSLAAMPPVGVGLFVGSAGLTGYCMSKVRNYHDPWDQ